MFLFPIIINYIYIRHMIQITALLIWDHIITEIVYQNLRKICKIQLNMYLWNNQIKYSKQYYNLPCLASISIIIDVSSFSLPPESFECDASGFSGPSFINFARLTYNYKIKVWIYTILCCVHVCFNKHKCNGKQ